MSSHRAITAAPTWPTLWLLLASFGGCSTASKDTPQCAGVQRSASSVRDGRAACDSAAASGARENASAPPPADARQHASAADSCNAGSCAPTAGTGATRRDDSANGCNAANAGSCAPTAGTGATRRDDSANGCSAANAGNCAPTAGSNASAHDKDAAAGSAASPSDTTGAAGSGSTPAGGAGGAGGAASTSAATSCSAPNLVFCDDFEKQGTSGMPPAAPWTIANNGMGHSVIDTQTPAHSGQASVKVTSEGGYQTFFALTGAPAFPHDGALYLRIYMRLEAAMTSGHNTYYKAGAGGSPSSDHETRMGVMNGMLMINQPAGDRGFLSNEEYYRDGNKPGVVFAPMTWVCVETFFDPANKTIDVWVDGKEVKDLHRTDWEQDPIGSLHFGFEKYAGPDATIWYDDIALSSQPIGCR